MWVAENESANDLGDNAEWSEESGRRGIADADIERHQPDYAAHPGVAGPTTAANLRCGIPGCHPLQGRKRNKAREDSCRPSFQDGSIMY